MPFAFAIVGIVFVIAGVRGTSATLLGLLKNDVAGDNSFFYWMLSIAILGALGYIEDFRPLSRAFMVLIIVVLVLAQDKQGHGGFFTKFQQAIGQITDSTSTRSAA